MSVVATGWIYVVLMMALAEATSPAGSLLGAAFTFVLYGLLPLALVLYVMRSPARRAARRAAEAKLAPGPSSALEPDRSGHAASDALAPERKEP